MSDDKMTQQERAKIRREAFNEAADYLIGVGDKAPLSRAVLYRMADRIRAFDTDADPDAMRREREVAVVA